MRTLELLSDSSHGTTRLLESDAGSATDAGFCPGATQARRDVRRRLRRCARIPQSAAPEAIFGIEYAQSLRGVGEEGRAKQATLANISGAGRGRQFSNRLPAVLGSNVKSVAPGWSPSRSARMPLVEHADARGTIGREWCRWRGDHAGLVADNRSVVWHG